MSAFRPLSIRADEHRFRQVALVVFEVVAFGLVLSYWPAAARVHDAVFITITILAYTALQIWDSRWFGNAGECTPCRTIGYVQQVDGFVLSQSLASRWASESSGASERALLSFLG